MYFGYIKNKLRWEKEVNRNYGFFWKSVIVLGIVKMDCKGVFRKEGCGLENV